MSVLARYDAELRLGPSLAESRTVDRTARVVRVMGGSPDSSDNGILWSKLTAADADAEIAAQVAHFRRLGRAFEWKLHGHDTPADLDRRLLAHGFTQEGDDETLMALDLTRAGWLDAPPPVALRKLAPGESLVPLLKVQNEVWNDDHTWLGESLAAEQKRAPELMSIYVAEEDGRVVSTAWVRYPKDSAFATLWGGSTLEKYRGRGIYRALVAARGREAVARSRRWLLVDAGPMSRPILATLGFEALTSVRAFIWKPTGSL